MGQARPDGSLLARRALDWLLVMARERGAALAWTSRPDDDELDPTLYSGTAGIVVACLEGYQHFRDDRYAEAAARGALTIAAAVDEEWPLSSLYFGLAGMAFALRAAHDKLGDHRASQAAGRALDLVRSRFDGERWADQFELLGGNAGIALAAARAGDLDLAVLAVEPYLAAAEPTAGGVHWEVRAGVPARFHHMSHGTLGIVYALAAIGHTADRGDLVELAVAGAADVVSRNEAGPAGFLVPHSDPQHKPERIERYSYGWCHGPAGDAQAFRLLAQVTGDPAWVDLAGRCWHTVTRSGLPSRLRPGFWDNSGRCCGTAGVLALACDRHVEQADDLTFADVLASDLASRATLDTHGARWSNYEHRASPSALTPRTGWAMGNAGIIRELLRYARIHGGQDPDYAIAWPDHPVARRAGRLSTRPSSHRHQVVLVCHGTAEQIVFVGLGTAEQIVFVRLGTAEQIVFVRLGTAQQVVLIRRGAAHQIRFPPASWIAHPVSLLRQGFPSPEGLVGEWATMRAGHRSRLAQQWNLSGGVIKTLCRHELLAADRPHRFAQPARPQRASGSRFGYLVLRAHVAGRRQT